MSDFTKIDGVNWVRRTFPSIGGDVTLVGMSVRAMRKALDSCDPDDLVVYMCEQTPESREADLLLGIVSGLGSSEHGTVFLIGPEAIKALKAQGKI